MSNTPLMPIATAVWLVENTSLTFKQIADFCKLHEVEVQGIADGEVGKGIVAYNPIMSGQLSREEIELSSKDTNRALCLSTNEIKINSEDKKIKKVVTERLVCPLGFSLGGNNPKEIAVSISAQLLYERDKLYQKIHPRNPLPEMS